MFLPLYKIFEMENKRQINFLKMENLFYTKQRSINGKSFIDNIGKLMGTENETSKVQTAKAAGSNFHCS